MQKEDKEQNTIQYVKENILKLYISHIPMDSVKEFPYLYQIYFGGIAYLVMIG